MNRLNQVKRMTQMIQSTQSMDLIYQLNQLNQLNSIQYFVDLFGKTIYFVDLFLRKRSISLTFFGYFESIQLIQSNQSLKIYRLSHLFYENELTQSPINSLGKKLNQLNQFSGKKWIDLSQSTQSSWIVYKSGQNQDICRRDLGQVQGRATRARPKQCMLWKVEHWLVSKWLN